MTAHIKRKYMVGVSRGKEWTLHDLYRKVVPVNVHRE